MLRTDDLVQRAKGSDGPIQEVKGSAIDQPVESLDDGHEDACHRHVWNRHCQRETTRSTSIASDHSCNRETIATRKVLHLGLQETKEEEICWRVLST